jgi:GNAT superfamily N-acetyltransferase
MTHVVAPRGVRRATPADTPEIARVLTEAFFDDPVWGPTFPDPERRRAQANEYWRFMVGQATRYSESLIEEASDGSVRAVAMWYPPGADEVAAEDLHLYEQLVSRLLPADAAQALFQAGDRFAQARPAEPHAYLNLLAVSAEARGQGAGMGLLRVSLDRYDTAGLASYLESSNPANDARYERQGYLPRGHVELGNGTRAQTYWRAAQR